VAGDAAFPRVEGYTITRVIGTGGFSTVYEATQDDIGSTVALKVLNVSIHDEAGARRLDREYRSMGRLRDQPGIVPVYGTARTSEGNAVIVMAFMPGGSLLDRIRRTGPLSGSDAERMAVELADALTAAHAVGIHHRDIKPENVLFDAYGHASLSDFGLATVEGLRDASQTAASLSPPHAPPERFTGDANPDPVAGDVYSLASTLHQSLTGTPPFGTSDHGGIVGLINRVCNDPVPTIDRPDVAEGLRAAILAGLAKAPSDRPSSVGEFRSILSGAPPPATEQTVTLQPTPTTVLASSTLNATRVISQEPVSPPASADWPTRLRHTNAGRLAWAILPVLLALGGTFAALSWYAHSQYFVGFDGQQVSVYQGVPGGFLLWDPEVVWTSNLIERGDLTASQRLQISRRNTYGSRADAEAAVRRIEDRVFPATTTIQANPAFVLSNPNEYPRGLTAHSRLVTTIDCAETTSSGVWLHITGGSLAGQYVQYSSTVTTAGGGTVPRLQSC